MVEAARLIAKKADLAKNYYPTIRNEDGVLLKKVIFENGRTYKHGRLGHMLSGYKDRQTGREVRFSNLPLCELNAKGDLIQLVTNDEQGRPVVALYGQDMNFSESNSISFDPITHYLVIDALRKCHIVATTNSPENYVTIKSGRVIERQPGVKVYEEEVAAMKVLNAMEVVSFLRKNIEKLIFRQVKATLNIKGQNRIVLTRLSEFATKQPDKILNIWKTDKDGIIEPFELSDVNEKNSVGNMAVQEGLITFDQVSGTGWIFNGISMGQDYQNYLRLHPEIFEAIKLTLSKKK